ncbi:MAG: Dihydroorotate dehydrogenase 2 [Parcubacteria group bacterium GW2011_GWC1_38_6]|nr:MAG: Dihydroorotate dehydrogenase 2 [Parcubacteria group bacterium GW2011_GWA1_36_12]KKQ77506.1 MAG: Dihydroorotate dehydrogenase 2 [Parcubacteria group bacterium GW2011_GWC1_38_6]
MKDFFIAIRNALIRFLYKLVAKPIFFLQDPEKVHDKITFVGQLLGDSLFLRSITALFFSYSNKALKQEILGMKFKNPIGLAAGFDKNAVLYNILPSVGFGFAELGSFTGEPCKGNEGTRLWRLKKSKALVIYYGLKNDGSKIISKRLVGKKFRIPIGTSVAKTNSKDTVELQAGIQDYVKAFRCFVDVGDYFVINISCPNAFGGEPFCDPTRLDNLLVEIDKIETKKPIFLKIAADLSYTEVDSLINTAERHRVHGFICTNLTKDRNNKKIIDNNIPKVGGISGKAMEDISNSVISYVYKKTKGKFVIIGCGGVFSAKDAYRKIKLGANLVELITGMIFEGPQLISEINQGLVCLLKKDGFTNISQAIGSGNK